MNGEIYFADAELPFHVWVREHRGNEGYKWVLREARGIGESEVSGGDDPGLAGPAPEGVKRAA